MSSGRPPATLSGSIPSLRWCRAHANAALRSVISLFVSLRAGDAGFSQEFGSVGERFLGADVLVASVLDKRVRLG
jgi:hypothetical protein